MIKKTLLQVLLIALPFAISAQKHITKNGYIEFYGKTPLEEIKAGNNQVASILDVSTGEIVFQVLMKSFHFERALMEEHFNENYVESEKFPKSVFKGRITNLSDIDFAKPGVYTAQVEGDLTLHNISKKISQTGTIEIIKDGIVAKSNFKIKPEDYDIQIPSVVRDKIAKEMDVTVNMKYNPMTQ
ncbi:MAG TPA: YceI family protein [Cyclobacteriaceae bacterium]|nr:YceI family protein [Cyclobacteriaceae bacterium]